MSATLTVDAPESASALAAMPDRIGRFVVREEIGRGSNGVVYAAVDPVLGRDVAIKAIPLDAKSPGQAELEAGFLQEAKIAAGLNHPSIVTVFDAGKTDTLAYIAMERLKGLDLHHWLANHRLMSPENAAALVARVADAVHFAHRRGLIHRDIKPSNIFLGRDMKPKVLDFGIALAQEQQGRPDQPKKLIGTPNYMSPEQALARPLDARSDVFSMGAILYELVTGHRAFDGANIEEILAKVVKIDPPAVASWRPEVPAVMSEIIMRALAKDPAARYQTAGQLRNDLAAFAGRPAGPPTSPNVAEAAVPVSAPRWQVPGKAALISTLAALVGLSLTFALWLANNRAGTGAEAAPVSAPSPAPAAAPNPTAAPRPAGASTHPPAADDASTAPAGSEPAAGPEATDRAAKSWLPSAREFDAPSPSLARTAKRAAARPRASAAETPPTPPPPAEPGTLTLAIVPWGQVLIDGNDAGVSPPLNHLSLPAGKHTIEIRNGNAPAFVQEVELESGKSLALQHRF